MATKDNALVDFIEMIQSTWTYGRMTEKEQERCITALHGNGKLCGSYKQRGEWLHTIYHAYLLGLGYDGPDWRKQ